MGSIRERKGMLFLDFRFNGVRCREQTIMDDNTSNRRRLEAFMAQIDQEIKTGTLDYAKYFPNSSNLSRVMQPITAEVLPEVIFHNGSIKLKEFTEEWYLENEVTWKISHQKTVRGIIDKYMIPCFGELETSHITKGNILKFRSSLAKVKIGKKVGLSPVRINHIMTVLRMILNDAADRHKFSTPFAGIKPLKVGKSDVDPFTIDEVNLFLAKVRNDFKNYYTTRFFTGMRTGEIDGLQWKYVDFGRKEILIRETVVEGRIETPKTLGSAREIHMSALVFQALQAQHELTADKSDFVFCNQNFEPLNHCNVTKRVWYPTLELLNMKRRRPYQTRHTMATLWLASGENPEWIARQMGHNSTEMLFTVYSRFVPNLTRRDGSALENLLASRMPGGAHV